MTAVPPRPAAPDVSTDTGALREVADSELECLVAEVLHTHDSVVWAEALDLAAQLLALPALRDLIAERDQAVAAVGRVEELADALDAASTRFHTRFVASGDPYDEGGMDALTTSSRRIRQALDGTT